VERMLTRLRRTLIAASVGAAFFAMSAMAFAEETPAQGEAVSKAAAAGGANALIPKPAEFIPAVISFLLVLLILSKFAWPAITAMLDQRAENIRESLERAEQAKIDAERMLEEYKVQLAEARKEANAILAQAKSAADTTIAEASAKARADAEALVEKARAAIEGEKRAAIADLQRSVADISVSVAGKLIGTELSQADHEAVIAKYLAESGSINAN
jgi:F-type H+-transporting ATPase subunit b